MREPCYKISGAGEGERGGALAYGSSAQLIRLSFQSIYSSRYYVITVIVSPPYATIIVIISILISSHPVSPFPSLSLHFMTFSFPFFLTPHPPPHPL